MVLKGLIFIISTLRGSGVLITLSQFPLGKDVVVLLVLIF